MLLLLHQVLVSSSCSEKVSIPWTEENDSLESCKKTGVQTLLWKRCQDFRKQTRKSREIILVKKKFVKLKWDLHCLARIKQSLANFFALSWIFEIFTKISWNDKQIETKLIWRVFWSKQKVRKIQLSYRRQEASPDVRIRWEKLPIAFYPWAIVPSSRQCSECYCCRTCWCCSRGVILVYSVFHD